LRTIPTEKKNEIYIKVDIRKKTEISWQKGGR